MDRAAFHHKLETALKNLRDIARLRATDLSTIFVPNAAPGQRGWELNAFLLRRINELSPSDEDRDSWPWRRFNLLTLRFVNDLPVEEIATTLQLSQRHTYRQLERAIDEFAEALWAEFNPRISETTLEGEEPGNAQADSLDLLYQESASILQHEASASLAQVVSNVSDVLGPILAGGAIEVTRSIPPDLPAVSLNPEILRQFLLGLLGHLIQRTDIAALHLRAQEAAGEVGLTVRVQWRPGEAKPARESSLALDRVSAQFAALQGVRTEIVEESDGTPCFCIYLPADKPQAVLVVDDNPDVGLLLRRYLLVGGYQPIIATTAAEAIALARSQPFYAVTLDLMMDNKDGWDVLQTLANDVRTEHIPVIVCSVLDQKDLALMLGASAFLRKPIMPDALLQALADIKPRRPVSVAASE